MNKKMSTKEMVTVAVLMALIILMAFTPLGYLKTAGIEITFIMIPVIIGAVLLGRKVGAFLGAIFGITSFIQCVTGASWFGMMLMNINPVFTFLLCMVPRILMGYITGIIFDALYTGDNKKPLPFIVASLAGPLLNTTLFVGGFILMFSNTEFFASLKGSMSLMGFCAAFVGVNGAIEAVACLVLASAIVIALAKYTHLTKRTK